MIIASDDVPQRTESLLDTLDLDLVRDAVSEVLELLVGGGGGDQQALAVPGGQAPDDAGAGDSAVADRDDVLQLGLEDAVEVFGCADCD